MQLDLSFIRVSSTDVIHAIQLSLAPVFLLNGVGVMLGVLTNRLARIIDRARNMEQRLLLASGEEERELHDQLRLISRRARLINRGITLGTITALLVAAVVAMLFATAFLPFSLGMGIAAVFIVSMFSLIGALWCFLVEIRMATLSLRFGPGRKSK